MVKESLRYPWSNTKGADPRAYVMEARLALNQERWEAGNEYHFSLVRLGLLPDVLCWVYLVERKEMELALVTPLIDVVGPKAIYELLFRAYDASATPKEIDPFIVAAYSPKTNLAKDLQRSFKSIDAVGNIDIRAGLAAGVRPSFLPDGTLMPHHALNTTFRVGTAEPRLAVGAGIYSLKASSGKSEAESLVDWHVFKSRVEALAA